MEYEVESTPFLSRLPNQAQLSLEFFAHIEVQIPILL